MKCKFSVDGVCEMVSYSGRQINVECSGDTTDKLACPFWRIGRDPYGQKQ